MRRRNLALFLLAILIMPAHASVMESPDKTVIRSTFPDDSDLKNDTQYKRKFEEINSELSKLKERAEEAKSKLRASTKDGEPEADGGAKSEDFSEIPKQKNGSPDVGTTYKPAAKVKLARRTAAVPQQSAIPMDAGFSTNFIIPPSAQVFATSGTSAGVFTVLPTGSHVRAKVVSGVEANAQEPFPVLLQMDYAFTGPNKTRVDLSSCFLIAKARANLSTERVMMETESLSCVRDDGEHFKSSARGFVAGEDNTFGATGTYISKQGQVLLAAVLANIAKNAGDAVAIAQQSTLVSGADKAATATNVTGSKAAFIAGKSVVDAGSLIATWYLEQAKQLVPSIGVGSGQDVHVIMLESIKVPTLRVTE